MYALRISELAHNPEPVLIACTLTGADQQDRLVRWHELLRTARITRVPAGANAEVSITTISELTALIIAEQECCPFFRFELTFEGRTATVTITADDPALVVELLPRQSC